MKGWKTKYKELLLFSKGRGQIWRDREYTEIFRNLERKKAKKIY